MVGAQQDATFKECFGGVSICENSFLHAAFSSLEDLLNDFHCFFLLSNWAEVCAISLM